MNGKCKFVVTTPAGSQRFGSYPVSTRGWKDAVQKAISESGSGVGDVDINFACPGKGPEGGLFLVSCNKRNRLPASWTHEDVPVCSTKYSGRPLHDQSRYDEVELAGVQMNRKMSGIRFRRSIVGWVGKINGVSIAFDQKGGKWTAKRLRGQGALPCHENTLRRAVTCAKSYVHQAR